MQCEGEPRWKGRKDMVEQMSASATIAVRTEEVPVRVFTRSGGSIDGRAHVKPGAYQRRVSDVLNLGKVKYIAITDATYTVPGETPVSTACVLVNVDDVVMMDVGAEAS